MKKVPTNKPLQKVALITGGSSGIGLAIAHELAARGFSLLLVSNQSALLEQCKIEIEARHTVECHLLFADLSTENAARELFDYTKQQGFEVEILVNNAGMLIFAETAEIPTEKINIALQLHVSIPTLLCRLFGNEMKNRNSGHILNVSSISSVMPYPGISVYGPSKTYMRYFTRALRSEMKIYGVNVTCLIPGATATALYDPNKINLKLAMRLGIMQTPGFVARKAIRALFRKKAECIPGLINKLVVLVLPWIPAWLIYMIHKNTNLVQKGNESLGE